MKYKKYLFILVIALCSFVYTSNVFAATQYVTLIGDDVRVRKGPGTNYDKWGNVDIGETYDLIDDIVYKDESTSSSNNCTDGWHKVQYATDKVGYICKSYVKVSNYVIVNEEAKNKCENDMKNLGFPASYWDGLCDLKTKHPTWSFEPIQTNLDWEYVITKESSCGKNLIQTSDETYKDLTCNEGYGSWYPVSKKAVAYYMDPRNFLTEKHVFQFEYLRYDSKLSSSYVQSLSTMLNGAAFYKYHANLGNDLSSLINEAGGDSEVNVNPVHIGARMKQELGTGTSLVNLYGGAYNGDNGIYLGYYNFFNMGVSDSCVKANGTTYCGLSYAFKKGWNSPLKAIKGGASLLANNYISKGQYNIYLQKFNVVPTNVNKIFINQYMANLKAPSSESSTTYSTYNKLGLLETSFLFKIPVYVNMNAIIDNSGSGATGDEEDDNKITLSVPTIITSAGYKLSNNNVSGFKVGTKVDSIKSEIEAISGKDTVKIVDSKGNNYSGVVATNIKIKITTGNGVTELTVVVKGDTSGDGVINALDLLQVQKDILNTYEFNDVQKLAGDTSGDNKINALDLLQVQKDILNTFEIKQ